MRPTAGRSAVSIGSGHDPGERETAPETRTRRWWILALAGLTGTFAVLACYALISSAGELGAGSPAATVRAASPTHGLAGTAAQSATASASPAAFSPTGSPASFSPAGSPAPRPLTVTSVTAFGPDGTSDGDNPGIVSRLLDDGTGEPWYSQWYATPDFGRLRSGTGLLLTLGATATVRDVQMVLGAGAGADVQVRVGNSASVNLPVVASASGVGGTVRLPVKAEAMSQYVLIWFTRLPPDGHGHYQVSVYSVAVEG